MIHPKTEIKFISPEMGVGIFATQFIPKGTITWIQDQLDIVLSAESVHELSIDYQVTIDKYAFRNRNGEFVLCWDNSRFVNHSFNSNCLTTPYDFEIAIRDILPGEELTDDYGYLNISEPFEAFCEGTDRTIVYPNDLLTYHGIWDKQIMSAMKNFYLVDQSLISLLDKGVLDKIENIIKGKIKMDSILDCYCEEVFPLKI